MSQRYKAVLLFGAPGVGKGTQGALLGRIPGYFHLSTGDMFRSMDRQSELGQVFHQYSSKGELVPDEITVDLWSKYTHALTVVNEFSPHRDLMVLDGLPRTVHQVDLIKDHIDTLQIVHLVAKDREQMVQRLRGRALKEKRPDDAKEEVVRNRLDVYDRETRPVLDCFDPALVEEVDALGSPGEVLRGVLGVVTGVQEAAFSNALKA
ncbi:MAG: adenylate kinase family protein [Phycisphaerales bacterium]